MATEKKAKAMNKSQMAAALAEKTELTKAQVSSVIAEMDALIKGQLGKKGPGVFQIPGLIKLQVRMRPAQPAKKGRNPLTGQEIMIPAKKASKRVVARPLKALKDAVL
jgi:nucleoid DNA-binding protein